MTCIQEHKSPLAIDSIIAEANRCLNCYDAPCMRACPTGIDVPGFIKKIATGNLRGSAKTILSSNVLGASCARVCPTEVLCEGACVLNNSQKNPIPIGLLQRHATDWAMANNMKPFEMGPKSRGRVAIIGAGPAGLACAAELLQRGHEALIFEANAKAGGLNLTGVAAYKMSAEFAEKEVDWLVNAGIEIQYNARIGTDISLSTLEEQFDAVFVAVGMGAVGSLGLPGENLKYVVEAISFIESIKTQPEATVIGRRIFVIGGGNTSIDCVTQAKLLGAEEVTLIYRRGPSEMPAYAHEVELARSLGCQLMFNVSPVAITGKTFVEGLVLQKNRLGDPDPSGRRALEAIPGEVIEFPCDMVVLATGQEPHHGLAKLLAEVGVSFETGRVAVDRESFQTSHPRYFAGGDCVSGGKEVVNAVAEGKRAAQSISALLLNPNAKLKETTHG